MKRMLIKKSALARAGGVKPPTMTELCKKGLKGAVHDGEVDINHPKVQAWLKKRKVDPIKLAAGIKPKQKKGKSLNRQAAEYEADENSDLDEMENMTIKEIAEKYTSLPNYYSCLKAMKTSADVRAVRLKNAKEEGLLISKVLVEALVFEPIETSLVQMQTDGSMTIAVRARKMIEAGKTDDDIVEYIRKQLSSFIKPMKQKVKRGLKNV